MSFVNDPVYGQLISMEPEENVSWRRLVRYSAGFGLILLGLLLSLFPKNNLMYDAIELILILRGIGYIAEASLTVSLLVFTNGIVLDSIWEVKLIPWDRIDYYTIGKGRKALQLVYRPFFGGGHILYIPDSMPHFQHLVDYIKLRVVINPAKGRFGFIIKEKV